MEVGSWVRAGLLGQGVVHFYANRVLHAHVVGGLLQLDVGALPICLPLLVHEGIEVRKIFLPVELHLLQSHCTHIPQHRRFLSTCAIHGRLFAIVALFV